MPKGLSWHISSHQHLGSVRLPLLPLYDKETFDSIPVEDILPIEVDDDYITDELVLPQPDDIPNLTTGFNTGARLFWIGCTQLAPSSRKRVLAPSSSARFDSNITIACLKSRLDDLQAATQGLGLKLDQWSFGSRDPSNPTEDVTGAQFESLRANVQVTHLWLQSTLLENLFSFEQGGEYSSDPSDLESQHWSQRENICQQLLSVLYNIRQCSLEPNGNSLVSLNRTNEVFLETEDDDFRHTKSAKLHQLFSTILSNSKVFSQDGSSPTWIASLMSWLD